MKKVRSGVSVHLRADPSPTTPSNGQSQKHHIYTLKHTSIKIGNPPSQKLNFKNKPLIGLKVVLTSLQSKIKFQFSHPDRGTGMS